MISVSATHKHTCQRGVLPIFVIGFVVVLAIVAVVGAKAIKPKLFQPIASADPKQYQLVLRQFLDLKQKEASDEARVASVSAFRNQYPGILQLIATANYASASSRIASISAALDSIINQKNEADRLASEAAAKKKALEDAARKAAADAAAAAAQAAVNTVTPQSAPAPVSVSAPASGYANLTVTTDRGSFNVDVVTADVGAGARVITDTATTSDCADNCPLFALATYIARNGGYAGMNGSYFCPQDYTSCAGQVNSTNYFAFNYQEKTFINANKRDYDNAGGLFVFRPGSIQFFRNPASFGLDTSITGAIACYPTLVAGGGIVVNEGALDDKSRTVKGNRGSLAIARLATSSASVSTRESDSTTVSSASRFARRKVGSLRVTVNS